MRLLWLMAAQISIVAPYIVLDEEHAEAEKRWA